MDDASPYELELTPELLESARKFAYTEAKKRCPKYVNLDDVVQEVLLQLISKPPKFDPAKGVKTTTLIYTIVQRGVLKYIARQSRHAEQFPQASEKPIVAKRHKEAPAHADEYENRRVELLTKSATTEDIFDFVDSEEGRALCQAVLDCNGNMSAAAKRLGVSEGTVRYRIKMLAPRLKTAGFNPFNIEE